MWAPSQDYDFRQLQLRSAAGSSLDGLSLPTGCCWSCGDTWFSCSDMGLSMRVVELKWLIFSDMCGLGCAKWSILMCVMCWYLKFYPPRKMRLCESQKDCLVSMLRHYESRNTLRHCEEGSDLAISSWLSSHGNKSVRAALTESINLSFLFRFQDLISFSRSIAWRLLLIISIV